MSSVSQARARGNTLLPSTLTLLIGLRVTHSWGCVYVCVYVCVGARATNTHTYTHRPVPDTIREEESFLPLFETGGLIIC